MNALKRTVTAIHTRSPLALPLLAMPVWLVVYILLQPGTDLLVGAMPLPPAGHAVTEAVRFFLFEVPKVLLLLVVIVFVVGIIRTWFSPERTRRALEGRSLFAGNVAASLLGVVTPFCSCSAVPLFIGFIEAGVPLGVTLSFLISAPMVNEVALVLLLGLFGWETAALYLGTGLAIAMTAGWVIGRLRLERWVEPWVYEIRSAQADGPVEQPSRRDRIEAGYQAVRDIVAKVWPYVTAGIAVGAFAHGYVPADYLAGIMGEESWWAVPLSVAIGVPLYSNAAGIVPIVQVLLEKGASLGTALAFMMAVIGLSLPETIILRRVLRPGLIAVFIGTVGSGIMLVGFLFNLIF